MTGIPAAPPVPMSPLMTEVFARFDPSTDVARFIVPAGVSVEAALDSLKEGCYRPREYNYDPETRRVQFGPTLHSEFGNLGMFVKKLY